MGAVWLWATDKLVGAQLVREPHTNIMAAARQHCGLSAGPRTPEGLQRTSEANLKHGRQTKDKLAAQRHADKVRRRVQGELKRIEQRIADAGLMPDDCVIHQKAH